MASTVNDTLDMKYADLGVLEGKLKELFGSSYEIEDQHESYLLTIPRKLTTNEKQTIQNESERRRKARKARKASK